MSYNEILNKAIKLGESGIPVFPCLENKAPACSGGFKVATKDPKEIERLFRKYRAILIGVPTGVTSGISVLDIDPKNGGNDWYNENRDKFEITRIHQTRSGGLHLLFKHKNGLRCSGSKIAAGIDIRADGGYIIWWPANNLPVLCDVPMAEWPEWVLPQEKSIEDRSYKSNIKFDDNAKLKNKNYAMASLYNAAKRVRYAQEGTRNSTLNCEAWKLLRFVNAGTLNISEIMNTLASAALSAGLNTREIAATLSSGLSSAGE